MSRLYGAQRKRACRRLGGTSVEKCATVTDELQRLMALSQFFSAFTQESLNRPQHHVGVDAAGVRSAPSLSDVTPRGRRRPARLLICRSP